MEYIPAHEDARFLFPYRDIQKSYYWTTSPRRGGVLFVFILLILNQPLLISQNKMFSRRKEKAEYKTESWWNGGTWNRKWRWNKNAASKDVPLSAFITQLHAGTVCSQRKSLQSWLLTSWTWKPNSAFRADPNFDDCSAASFVGLLSVASDWFCFFAF